MAHETVDRLIDLWLKSKGFYHDPNTAGYWVDEDHSWYLWSINTDEDERHSVFLEKFDQGEWSCLCEEYDLREPDSLARLEADIQQCLKLQVWFKEREQ